MKGTIDASIPDAKEIILQDSKEMAEHTMIVDLMRNDLNIVATQTKVEKFRYIQQIKAGSRELIQVSSKISAKLPKNWRESIGTILEKLTPAGSISGTPKKKTLEIIDEVESYERGFYSGVFGVCRGDILESAVMIRFIESGNSSLIYKSGGGITIDSQNQKEYQELIDKVYIPI
jgi:para-aminobenzoate synthetase component 1